MSLHAGMAPFGSVEATTAFQILQCGPDSAMETDRSLSPGLSSRSRPAAAQA